MVYIAAAEDGEGGGGGGGRGGGHLEPRLPHPYLQCLHHNLDSSFQLGVNRSFESIQFY